jgi:hypothetical protein
VHKFSRTSFLSVQRRASCCDSLLLVTGRASRGCLQLQASGEAPECRAGPPGTKPGSSCTGHRAGLISWQSRTARVMADPWMWERGRQEGKERVDRKHPYSSRFCQSGRLTNTVTPLSLKPLPYREIHSSLKAFPPPPTAVVLYDGM